MEEVDIDLNTVSQRLYNPILVDNSTLEKSEGGINIETTESFKVFFPDGSMSSLHGGQQSLEKFQDLVKKQKKVGTKWSFKWT